MQVRYFNLIAPETCYFHYIVSPDVLPRVKLILKHTPHSRTHSLQHSVSEAPGGVCLRKTAGAHSAYQPTKILTQAPPSAQKSPRLNESDFGERNFRRYQLSFFLTKFHRLGLTYQGTWSTTHHTDCTCLTYLPKSLPALSLILSSLLASSTP